MKASSLACFSIILSIIVSGCTSPEMPPPDSSAMMNMRGMPCHQMPDGAWMGDCDKAMNTADSNTFSQDTEGLPLAKATETITLQDGDTYDMTAGQVVKEVDGKQLRMLAYNGSIPGPTIQVEQGAEITLRLSNQLDTETLFHSHGLRLHNRFDGTQLTQQPIKVGEQFEYKLRFPDAGIYWYHPHLREEYTQESGLYGNYLVTPKAPDYWSPVNREITITLDDILIENGKLAPFYTDFGTHALMGRFGNTMLTNGQTDYQLEAQAGEVIRLYLTNVANTRTFNVTIPGAQIKRVAADISKYEYEEMVTEAIVSPSERVVLDVFFPDAGSFSINNSTPHKVTPLANISVSESVATPSYATAFETLRTNEDVITDIDVFREHFNRDPDKHLSLTIDMGMMGMGMQGMDHGMMMGHESDSIEWEDTMPMMNEQSTSESLTWKIVDTDTGKENMDINWTFEQGELVKIRIFNDPNSEHPMQHPFHIHGERFLVLATNEIANENLAWKDTVLIPSGDTVDILVDMSNWGKWMAHCHIAEHLESGMMMGFEVQQKYVSSSGS